MPYFVPPHPQQRDRVRTSSKSLPVHGTDTVSCPQSIAMWEEPRPVGSLAVRGCCRCVRCIGPPQEVGEHGHRALQHYEQILALRPHLAAHCRLRIGRRF